MQVVPNWFLRSMSVPGMADNVRARVREARAGDWLTEASRWGDVMERLLAEQENAKVWRFATHNQPDTDLGSE